MGMLALGLLAVVVPALTIQSLCRRAAIARNERRRRRNRSLPRLVTIFDSLTDFNLEMDSHFSSFLNDVEDALGVRMSNDQAGAIYNEILGHRHNRKRLFDALDRELRFSEDLSRAELVREVIEEWCREPYQ